MTPLEEAILQIKHAPPCKACNGTGLSDDELSECDECSGYGRGAGIFRRMIERVDGEGGDE